MRDFSKVGPRVWKSRKFWSLPDDHCRYTYLYLITNSHINSAGCYDLGTMAGAGDMRSTEEVFRNSLDTVSISGLVEWDRDESTIRVTNWFAFNEPNNPKHAIGMMAQLAQASSARLKLNQLNDLVPILEARGFTKDKPLQNAIRYLRETIEKQYPIRYHHQTRPDQEGDGEGDQEQTKREIKTEKIRTENARDGDPDAAPNGASVSPRYQPPPLQMPASADRAATLMETPLMRRTAK